MNLLTELHPHIGVGQFCTVFGKTRQAWYYATRTQAEQEMTDSIVVKMVKEIREEQPRLGTRKLYYLLEPQLQAHGIKMGRDALFDMLERYDLLIRHRRRRAITTDSNHPYRKYDNLIQHLILTGKNQLWVSDITYLRVSEGFCYLSLVTDAFSRKIVGYRLWPNLAARGSIEALNMALNEQQPGRNMLIHHSDRGVQYCCSDYVGQLQNYQINISMSHKGDPYQNAIAERVNGILKHEYSLNKEFEDLVQATKAVQAAVNLYNSRRPHDSLSYLTPDQAHELTGIIKRNWRTYSKHIIKNQDLEVSNVGLGKLCNAKQD
ncbi:Transposase InsO and inactivated derivatives [Filimonas lacunae]|uniref:Transposase InsO and inactivated derivatives n=1 Tax=Filimonas lacunae TaxID=477680 RepID=A0A173MD86_9BACT|nr:IS3 family transposase [Filimonas lacunae]SIT34832.1 Transposase InsO and inactivated derivatives [Filimonas lacunae]BAV04799.1 mobile element protein [Filimonas lacunae]BAV05160.1 mobile element protein [Filimonas lacunae]BAV05553.1 mobile element protein [Filimonas lacunae]BAV06796.1 mobile element protein [Filimonas lacunae]